MAMSGKWSQIGVPHRGWTCVSVDDLGAPDAVCEMCETQAIRYVHHMEPGHFIRAAPSSRLQFRFSEPPTGPMDGCANNEPYALQVTDSSMEPEFPKGCVIISEPNGVLENGCYVIGSDGDELVFRQLLIDDRGWRLHALQGDHADIPIDGPEAIRGRVIQRAGKSRKDRKAYL